MASRVVPPSKSSLIAYGKVLNSLGGPSTVSS